jgi:hypothetical protein
MAGTCGHEGCNCAAVDGDYCSEYCQRHATREGHRAHECNCGHPDCH